MYSVKPLLPEINGKSQSQLQSQIPAVDYRRKAPKDMSKVLNKPIVLLKNMTKRLGIDSEMFQLEKFSRKYANAKMTTVIQPVEMMGQWNNKNQYKVDENFKNYASYTKKFIALQKREGKGLKPINNPIQKELESGYIRFGANVDIDDWKEEMEEIRAKIPAMLQCKGGFDALSVMQQEVKGINTPQLYVKVPGVWTGGHEENCRFSSININHGPGSSEWGAVEGKYAPYMRQLVLDDFGVDIYKCEGNWFPDPDWLKEKEIPAMYRVQREGDTMLLQGSTLHWVRSLGFSISSSWNFGHLSEKQLSEAIERDNINKMLKPPSRSLVPMRSLCIDIADNLIHQSEPKELLGTERGIWRIISDMIDETLKSESECKRTLTKLGIDMTTEKGSNVVVNCENRKCNAELSVCYAFCVGCNPSKPSLKRKRKQLNLSSRRKPKAPLFLCTQCAVAHLRAQRTKSHRLDGFMKWDLSRLEELLKIVKFLAKKSTNQRKAENIPLFNANRKRKRSSISSASDTQNRTELEFIDLVEKYLKRELNSSNGSVIDDIESDAKKPLLE